MDGAKDRIREGGRVRSLWALLLLAGIFGGTALAGCGGDDEDTTASIQATTNAASVPERSTGAAAPASPQNPPAVQPPTNGKPAKVVLPNLVGTTVGAAQSTLGKLGLSGRAESVTGDRTEIEQSWEVCETHPGAGRRLAPGSPVTLVSAKPGGC